MSGNPRANEQGNDAVDSDFRSGCSIARSLDLIGDKWTLLIIRDLMWHGKNTFQALESSEEHIPTNILSSRLKRLLGLGLIEKTPYQERPVRYKYSLTAKGRSLEPILQSLMNWGHGKLGGGYFDPDTRRSNAP
ncbi:MAG: helix-turn-helix domain-containing protein [Pseudomonadota bacterium]